jgi:hypothetical protein
LLLTGVGSTPLLPTAFDVTLLGTKLWFVGTLIAGLVSAAVSNLSQYLKTYSELMFVKFNSLVLLVTLVICGETVVASKTHQGLGEGCSTILIINS